ANTASFSASVVQIGARVRRLIVAEPSHQWRSNVVDRLEELVRLPVGWDGYAGEPVSLLNANFALRVLEAVCSPESPVPQIVPGTTGDLQIEWHAPQGEIELHVRAPNDVMAWYRAADSNEEEELFLTTNFIRVADWVKLLERPRAASAAA